MSAKNDSMEGGESISARLSDEEFVCVVLSNKSQYRFGMALVP